jgi:hypothetical protein
MVGWVLAAPGAELLRGSYWRSVTKHLTKKLPGGKRTEDKRSPGHSCAGLSPCKGLGRREREAGALAASGLGQT